MRPLPCACLAATLVVLGFLPGCGSSTSTGCGPARADEIDRRSLVHVLPGAPPPSYLQDPPSSGPHQPVPLTGGVRTTVLPAPVQVGLLEKGGVLVQYRPGLAAAEVRRLAALAGTEVVVAPNPAVQPPDAVIATAWGARQTCTSVEPAELRPFIRDHQGKGAGAGH